MSIILSTIAAALLTFNSPNLGQVDSVLVFSPAKANRNTPAMILLHGRSGKYTNWDKMMDLHALSNETGFRIICPDGFPTSWYLDLEGAMQWRTFFWEELWPKLVEEYGMKPDRTFIDGLSMGGNGAMNIFLDHPEKFRGAGSMSGVLRLTRSPAIKKDIAKMTSGAKDVSDAELLEWSAINRLDRVKETCPKNFTEKILLISCGALDKRYAATAKEFADSCRVRGYNYIQMETPGGHKWCVWTWTVRYHIDWFSQTLRGKGFWSER